MAEFFDDRVQEASRCQKCERTTRASLSSSNGARNISGEFEGALCDGAICFLGGDNRRLRSVDRDRLRAGSTDLVRVEASYAGGGKESPLLLTNGP